MSSFETVELSDSKYESDGVRFLTINSKNLKGRGDICLYVPNVDKDVKDLPIYILLHGVYGSAWIWLMKGGAGHMAKKMMESNEIEPAIIVMPSDGLWGGGSAYLPHHSLHFDKWIVEDTITAVRENIPEAKENEAVCIGGLSMGGYGAMMLGIKYSEKFRAISAHSSLTELNQMKMFVSDPVEEFSDQQHSIDIIQLAKRYSERIPPLRFDCGSKDSLLDANRQLHKSLQEENISHIYEEFDGGHEWSYWQKNVERTFLFFDRHSSTHD